MSSRSKSSSTQPRRVIGSGKQASIQERLEQIVSNAAEFKIKHESTLFVLGHLIEHAKTTGSSAFMVTATVETIAFLEFGILMTVSMDTRTKNKIFGKDTVLAEEPHFKSPWHLWKDKVQFTVKVPKVVYLECLPGEGDVEDREFELPAKILMNVKLQPYMNFPNPGSAGVTMSLTQAIDLVDEVEKPAKKRKTTVAPEDKESKMQRTDDVDVVKPSGTGYRSSADFTYIQDEDL